MKTIGLALLLCLLVSTSSYGLATESRLVKWSSTITDTLFSFVAASAETSEAYVVTPDMSFQVNVTSANDSTNLYVYPIFSARPYVRYDNKQTAIAPGSAATATFVNTWATTDSADFGVITANGYSAGIDGGVSSPTLFVKWVAAGDADNETVTATTGEIIMVDTK